MVSQGSDTTASLAFLSALWGNGPHSLCWSDDGVFLYVHCSSPEDLLAQAADADLKDRDTWFGAHPLTAVSRGRGTRDDVAEVLALHADLDWAHETRRTNEPMPIENDVRERLNRIGPELQPSVVVHSGHGLQAWWLLAEAVTPGEGDQLMVRLDAGLAEVGLENGRSDLASILRLPGTMNVKAEPVPVVIEVMDLGRLFDPADLQEWLPEATAVRSGGGTRHRPGAVTDGQQALVDLVLARHGGHSPEFWRDGSIHIMRPGKDAGEGTGASIIVGTEGDPLLTVFSDRWPDLRKGTYMLGPDGDLHHPTDIEATIIVNASPPQVGPRPSFVVQTLAEFAATKEDGADPLLGDKDQVLIPANGDVMMYGDGGAGKDDAVPRPDLPPGRG